MTYVPKKLIRTDFLPASPGFQRLEAWLIDGELVTNAKSIIGWKVRTYAPANSDGDGDAHTTCDPIVPLGEISDCDAAAILRPDKLVEEYEEDTCSVAVWEKRTLAYLEEQQKRREELSKAG